MRWVFLLLLLLNGFYYVWHQQQAPLRVKEVEPLQGYQGVRQDIQLLSESAKTPDVSADDRVEGGSCLYLGGFELPARARELEQRLFALDVVASLVVTEMAAETEYWVHLEPLASRQATLMQLRELQARQIDGYIIGQGDLANGISLGFYQNPEEAYQRRDRVSGLGYSPKVRELNRAQRVYWMKIDPAGRRILEDSTLTALARDFPGFKQEIMPCKDVALDL